MSMATATAKANLEKPKPEKVKIHLFKDKDKYRQPLFVAVNGETYQIERGVEVEVPAYIAEVIQNSMKQDIHALEYMKELQREGDW